MCCEYSLGPPGLDVMILEEIAKHRCESQLRLSQHHVRIQLAFEGAESVQPR